MKKYLPYLIGAVSLSYLIVLSAKTYTWVFVSSDSGDWLACANRWMVPQPYGSPLYIALCRLVGLLPGSQPLNLTILLSCLPSDITIVLIYLIVKHLTNKTSLAIVSSLVLLGSAVFLSQSTVLEEYALAAMFLTAATYAYVKGNKMLTVVLLGLGTAVHIFIGTLLLAWLIAEWKSWRQWLKPAIVYGVTVGVSYSFILLLMVLDTPRLLAGGLNAHSLISYLTVTTGAILGQLSLFEAPTRLLYLSSLVLASLGLALIPIGFSWQKPITRTTVLLVGITLITLWYYGTNIDPMAWPFIAFASPALAILCGLGLARMRPYHKYIVALGAVILLLLNGVFLNANTLTNIDPRASTYRQELQSLPDGSIVLATPGAYSLGLFYVINEGKDLVPLIYVDNWKFYDYQAWLQDNYDITVLPSTLDTIEANLKDTPSYFVGSPNINYSIKSALELESIGNIYIEEITGLTGLPPEPELIIR